MRETNPDIAFCTCQEHIPQHRNSCDSISARAFSVTDFSTRPPGDSSGTCVNQQLVVPKVLSVHRRLTCQSQNSSIVNRGQSDRDLVTLLDLSYGLHPDLFLLYFLHVGLVQMVGKLSTDDTTCHTECNIELRLLLLWIFFRLFSVLRFVSFTCPCLSFNRSGQYDHHPRPFLLEWETVGLRDPSCRDVLYIILQFSVTFCHTRPKSEKRRALQGGVLLSSPSPIGKKKGTSR